MNTFLSFLTWVGSIYLLIHGLTIASDDDRRFYIIAFICTFLLNDVLIEIIMNLKALCCRSRTLSREGQQAFIQQLKRYFPIIYSTKYNISACGIEKCHPFDTQKYRRIF